MIMSFKLGQILKYQCSIGTCCAWAQVVAITNNGVCLRILRSSMCCVAAVDNKVRERKYVTGWKKTCMYKCMQDESFKKATVW